MTRDGTYYLGQAVVKKRDPRCFQRCDCGEPGIGYMVIYSGSVEVVGIFRKEEIRKVGEFPKCRTHFLAIEEKLIDPNIELKG